MKDQKPIQVETSADRDAYNTLTFLLFIFIVFTCTMVGWKLGTILEWKLASGQEPGAFTGFVFGFIGSLFIKAIREMLIILTVLGVVGIIIYFLYSWIFS